MRFLKVLFVLLIMGLLDQTGYSQNIRNIHWQENADGYYNIEGNNIIGYSLPSFEKQTYFSSEILTSSANGDQFDIEDYNFSKSQSKILLYTNSKKVWRKNTRGDYWIYDRNTNRIQKLGIDLPPSSLMFAKMSDDENKVAYVSQNDIYVQFLVNGEVKRISESGKEKIISGTFDWAYEEEFQCRDGFRWSPDSKQIAYWQVDARKIKDFLLINYTDSLYSFTKPVEYPKAGELPSEVKIGIVNIETGKKKWLEIPNFQKDDYIVRMEWAGNNEEIILQTLNRKQNETNYYLCNLISGAVKSVYQEKSDSWIEACSRWREDVIGWDWIDDGRSFIIASEKDGWRHLYIIDRNGKAEKLLTPGSYDILKLNGIDHSNRFIYFTASPDNATQAYLYRVPFSGSRNPELISRINEKGTHDYNLNLKANFALHQFSNHLGEHFTEWITLGEHTFIHSFNTQATNTKKVVEKKSKVEMFQVTIGDGITMDGWMVKPLNFDSLKKYPVVFRVYSEPNTTIVKDIARLANTRFYFGDMADDEYIQIGIDGRGTPAPKGAPWRKAIYRKMGIVNVRDIAMAAMKISEWSFVDKERLAVYGSSGGGSTTLNLLFQYPEIFSTGIAISPVPNQLLYDNIYEERYMGLPEENMTDYLECSPITHAKNLKGKLLIVHGTGDDNVHYQGTEMLINELVKYQKQFELMIYPNRTHALIEGEGTRQHLTQLFTDFLQKNCKPGAKSN